MKILMCLRINSYLSNPQHYHNCHHSSRIRPPGMCSDSTCFVDNLHLFCLLWLIWKQFFVILIHPYTRHDTSSEFYTYLFYLVSIQRSREAERFSYINDPSNVLPKSSILHNVSPLTYTATHLYMWVNLPSQHCRHHTAIIIMKQDCQQRKTKFWWVLSQYVWMCVYRRERINLYFFCLKLYFLLALIFLMPVCYSMNLYFRLL